MPLSQVNFPHKAPTFGFLPATGQGSVTALGNVFFVDSGSANAANATGNGKRPDKPFSTIDYAVGLCTANNGDVIFVAPGHTEDMAAAGSLDLDVAGIRVVGLGNGRDRPTITYSATAGDIDVDAANITLENFFIDVTGIDAVTGAIDVNAADFTLRDCEILMADSGGQATRCVVGATEADRMRVIGNVVRSTNAGAASFVNLVGTADGTEIAGNHIYGDFSVAAIENATSNVLTNVKIHHNYIQNDNNGNWAIELVSATTGVIHDNHVVTDAIATAVDWGACSAFGNFYFDDGDTDSAGTAIPTAQTTGGMDLVTIGDRLGADADTDAISAVLTGGAGVATWPTAAAYANAVNFAEVLGYIQDGVRRGSGTAMASNKSVADALGTDGTTITDSATSVLGVIGSNTGTTAFASTSVVANADGNVLERDEQLQQLAAMAGFYNSGNYLAVTADLTNATWNTVAAHEIATVTGAVRMLILPQCTSTVVTTGTNGTFILGDETNTSSLIASSLLDALATGEWWVDATITRTIVTRSQMNALEFVVGNGKDIGYTIGVNAATNGTIVFHIWWVPIDATGAVAAGAGGVL